MRWLVLSSFGVLALVNIWGLLALPNVDSCAIVEANMVGWNLCMRGSSPAGASGGRTGPFWWTNGHYCRSEMLRQNDLEDGMSIKAKPPTVLWAVRRLGSGFWVGVRWLVLSCFGVLALVNIWGLLALARVGSTAIVEANMGG